MNRDGNGLGPIKKDGLDLSYLSFCQMRRVWTDYLGFFVKWAGFGFQTLSKVSPNYQIPSLISIPKFMSLRSFPLIRRRSLLSEDDEKNSSSHLKTTKKALGLALVSLNLTLEISKTLLPSHSISFSLALFPNSFSLTLFPNSRFFAQKLKP